MIRREPRRKTRRRNISDGNSGPSGLPQARHAKRSTFRAREAVRPVRGCSLRPKIAYRQLGDADESSHVIRTHCPAAYSQKGIAGRAVAHVVCLGVRKTASRQRRIPKTRHPRALVAGAKSSRIWTGSNFRIQATATPECFMQFGSTSEVPIRTRPDCRIRSMRWIGLRQRQNRGPKFPGAFFLRLPLGPVRGIVDRTQIDWHVCEACAAHPVLGRKACRSLAEMGATRATLIYLS